MKLTMNVKKLMNVSIIVINTFFKSNFIICIFTDNYDYGLKLMYRAAKHNELHSEAELERGRGMRPKLKKHNLFEDLDHDDFATNNELIKNDSAEDNIMIPYPKCPKKPKVNGMHI